MPLGTGRAGRAGGKAGRTMGTSPLVSGSLCKAGKPVQRAGRFPLEPGKGMVVRMGSCTGRSTAAALFSGERGALEQKKSGRQARLFRRDRLFELCPCSFYA